MESLYRIILSKTFAGLGMGADGPANVVVAGDGVVLVKTYLDKLQ